MVPSARIDSVAEDSALVGGALAMAREAHEGQARETGNGPITVLDHLLAVSERAAEAGCGEEVLAAALLHDSVEKGVADAGEIRERLGASVGAMVEAMTEDESIADYEERKTEHRERLARSSPGARAIFAADKSANVAVLRAAYAERGEEVDARLPIPIDRKIDVWERDLEMLHSASPGAPLTERLADELVGLWEQRAGQLDRRA